MSLLVLDNISLSFGKKTIVEELQLRLADGDRIGLVGPNGSGKTSLLRVMAGEQAPEGGSVQARRGLRVGYLPQDIVLESNDPLLAFVRASVPGRVALEEEAQRAEAELEAIQHEPPSPAQDERLMASAKRIAELQERLTHYDVHFGDHEAMRILTGLGFADGDQARPLGELSGGWKMRAVLAALLFQRPDLLLLDEPTNHLDMPSVAWFGSFLQRYEGAFVLICHDREFLNEQIRRVVSFEPEGVRQYPGDYEQYVKQRAEEEVVLENKAKNLARERERNERFIERFRAKSHKAKAVQSRVKALERMETVEVHRRHKTMRLTFPPTTRTGNDVLRTEHLHKAFGERVVLEDVSLRVQRGEKVGIIGVNGAGKTTLLKMLAGELAPCRGEIVLGHNVKLGYFAQHHTDMLDPDATVFDEVARRNPDAGMTRVRTLLGAFLFSDDDVDKKIRVLSGGERARVALARLLIDPGNVLLMDEPTNHLDLASSEGLAEALAGFDGSVVFVSHNRSFVRGLATRIWDVADGRVETYPGSLDEYLDSCRRHLDGASTPTSTQKPAAKPHGTRAEAKERKRKAAEQRQRLKPQQARVRDLETRIAGLEARQAELEQQLAAAATAEDATKSESLAKQLHQVSAELEQLTERWEKAQAELDALVAGLEQGT